jgi:hypothetical protein
MLVYRWEFLRRNQEYISDYNDCISELKSIKGEQKDFAQDLLKRLLNNEIMSISGLIQKDLTYFMSHYDIWGVLNPAFDPQQIDQETVNNRLISCFAHKLAVAMLTDEYFLGRSDADIAKTRHLVLAVDADANIENIIEEVRSFVTVWKNKRSRVIKKKRRRVRVEEYARYLKVYELRKERKSYREIAKKVFPKEYKSFTQYSDKHEDVAPVIEKVKNNLFACQELVDGGYKIISL